MNEIKQATSGRGTFELLGQAERGLEITVRDDRCELAELLDAAVVDRRCGGRFRVVDSGRFSSAELEWLSRAGADLYTSDEQARSAAEIDLLVKAAARGGGIVAYFLHGEISDGAREIALTGAYLHVSNREKARDMTELAALAHACRRAEARLVAYQHGPLSEALIEVARNGGGVHLSDESLPAEAPLSPFLDMVRDAAAGGSGVVLHLEDSLGAAALLDIIKAGAHVIFRRRNDFRSPLRELEARAAGRRLDFRACYLTCDFLP
jgi:hypothetical protein